MLGMPMEQPPGEVFEYNGGATQLLASIIERASGQGIAAFAEKNLFEPLGIEVFEWNRYPPSQIAAAPSGLRLRSKDMMKFGLLYQNHGIWEGQQLLPAQWVEETFKAHVEKPGQPGAYYRYQFHVLPEFSLSGKRYKLKAAIGNGDQRIYFDEENDIMVVITAGNYNNWQTKNSLGLLKAFIYPSIFF